MDGFKQMGTAMLLENFINEVLVSHGHGQYFSFCWLNASNDILVRFSYFISKRNEQGLSVMLALKILFCST